MCKTKIRGADGKETAVGNRNMGCSESSCKECFALKIRDLREARREGDKAKEGEAKAKLNMR